MKTLSPLRLLAYAVSVLSCIPMTMAQYDYINTKLCFWDVQRTGELHYADPSPEATAMRRYQDYPVSHATGTADISIPVGELPAGDATVWLGLSYHTGAIKRDEEPTDVGLGWSLTGLGIISRRINGYPDEWTGKNDIGGFHNSRSISFRLDPHSQDWKYMLGIMEGWYDTDYDLFSYSIPGYSGHFIIRNDTTWYGATMSVRSEIKQLPPTDLHIDFSSKKKYGLLKYIFYITTPNGIRYEFDQADIVSRTTTMSSVRLSYADPDYEAEAVWHPTFITDNKRRGDTLRITYRDGGTWTRGGNYTSTAQGYMIYCDQYDNSYRTKYSSYDNIVKIENTVSAYTRMIPARISGKSGSIGFSSSGKASVITLKNAEGDVIKTVTLDNYSSHGDGRRRLDGVTIRSGNQIIDSYRFTYNSSVNAPGSDIFGYSNGSGYRYCSILGPDLKWEGRRPDPSSVSSASLKTVTDIAGVTTTLEYEPVNYDVGYGSLFGSYVCIGHRLRSIRAECPVTGRHRTRSFIYDRPRCNISLGVFNYTDFLTQSGFYEKTSLDGTFKYSFGVTHTTSPTTRGVSLENAVVYYGKVTEWVSGSGLEHPVRTHPSGYARKYGYKAGRLTKIMNTYGETMQEYSYRLYNDGCDELKHNSIRQKTYNTTKNKPFTNTGPMRTSVAIWPTDTTTVGEDIENSVWEEDDGYEEECKDCDIETCSCQTVYYDGFGLPVQTVAPVAGGSLVRTASEYDALDRPVRQYLPVPAADDSFLALFQPDISDYYGDNYPYSMVTYRMMRGDTPLQVLKEGEAMQGHPERYEYLCNSVTDQKLRCRRYRLSDSRDSESVTLDGYYPAGALDVTRVTDPDGCSMLTFTDWRGFRILERRPVDNDTYADTYYLYDIRGNVRVILQPEAAVRMTRDGTTWTGSDEVLDRLAFINRYDRRGNCIYAKTPGGGDVRMRYDPLNRLAFRQTAGMRERGEAEFTLYDPIGRVAVCGITPDGLPQTVPVMTTRYDGSDIAGSIDGSGYTVPAGLDISDAAVTQVNYYDS
ncbi:MAG: hypothetical protein K2L41_10600 [Muribaculaceae bacterium]|nr:hypothetical protein [Muribaculaceae bacterium]